MEDTITWVRTTCLFIAITPTSKRAQRTYSGSILQLNKWKNYYLQLLALSWILAHVTNFHSDVTSESQFPKQNHYPSFLSPIWINGPALLWLLWLYLQYVWLFSSPFTSNWLPRPIDSLSTISFNFPQCTAALWRRYLGSQLNMTHDLQSFTHRMSFRKLWSLPVPMSKVYWTLIKAVPITFCLLGIWS